jgi:hypothetical protein
LVESEGHLRRLCKERGLRSVHLENSINGQNVARNPTRRTFVWDKKQRKVVEVTNGR